MYIALKTPSPRAIAKVPLGPHRRGTTLLVCPTLALSRAVLGVGWTGSVRQRPPRLRKSPIVASFDAVGSRVAVDVVAACRPRASRAGVT